MRRQPSGGSDDRAATSQRRAAAGGDRDGPLAGESSGGCAVHGVMTFGAAAV